MREERVAHTTASAPCCAALAKACRKRSGDGLLVVTDCQARRASATRAGLASSSVSS